MRTVKADLHNHFTTRSRVLDPNKVADTVRESLGEGGICAIVNYADARYEAFARREEPLATNFGNAVYFQDRKILIIKGEEIPTQQGDHLVLGLDEGTHFNGGMK